MRWFWAGSLPEQLGDGDLLIGTLDGLREHGSHGQILDPCPDRFGGQKCLVMKPQTYMNLSGEAVHEAAQFYKIPADHVLVIYDDVSLPVGKLRVRPTGSAGGHNGIKNIIAHLGTQEFPRIKIGTGAPAGGGAEMIDWVIGVPSQAERKILVESFENAVKAAEDIIENGCQKAMNDYN